MQKEQAASSESLEYLFIFLWIGWVYELIHSILVWPIRQDSNKCKEMG
jgi:hypothetical protein